MALGKGQEKTNTETSQNTTATDKDVIVGTGRGALGRVTKGPGQGTQRAADQESKRTESEGRAEAGAARRVCVRGRNRPPLEVGHMAGRAERAPQDTLAQPRWTAIRARVPKAEGGPGWRRRREASSWGGRAGGCPTLPGTGVEGRTDRFVGISACGARAHRLCLLLPWSQERG